MAARFLRINSNKASSSAVTAMSLCEPSDRDLGSLVEVRTLSEVGDMGIWTAVFGRTRSSSSMTMDGCLAWLDCLLPLYWLCLG
jgi:hypothetical protein